MGSHLLRRLSGITIALSNLSGVIVFYVVFSDSFESFSHGYFVIAISVVAVRLGFCILIHQAIAATGVIRYLSWAVVVVIAFAPALQVSGPMPASVLMQLGLDVLIVLITIGLRSPNQWSFDTDLTSTYVVPEHAIALDSVINNYGVEELGGLYLYLPRPTRKNDIRARAWVNILDESQLIKSCYVVGADHATDAARRAQPHLFNKKVEKFDVYRLDMTKLKSSHSANPSEGRFPSTSHA